MRSLIGETIGHYEIIDQLGVGGIGEVYRARDVRLGREVAIKVLRQTRDMNLQGWRSLEREACAASTLNHPNVITIHDVGREGLTTYIAMELVSGVTLRQLLQTEALSVKRLLDIAIQITAGLANAHDAGVIHRDLKPENIMLTSGGLVKILDFGLARMFPTDSTGCGKTSSSITTGEGILGTVDYMSPEQIAGRPLDRRSDQFALGVILYEMAAGVRPFQRPTAAQTLAAILESDFRPLSGFRQDLPRVMEAAISRCLSKEPVLRFSSLRDLLCSLERIGIRPNEDCSIGNWSVVAVLPFHDLSPDRRQCVLSEAITEEIRGQLSNLSGVRLLSRYATARSGRRKHLRSFLQNRADHAIEGTVRVGLHDIRTTASLIDVRTELALWTAQYARPDLDVLAVPTDVGAQIVKSIERFLSRRNVPGIRDADVYQTVSAEV